jgi:hypothetical protein
MIVHQHERMHLQRKTLRQLGHRTQKPAPIRIIQEQRSRLGARDSKRLSRRSSSRRRMIPRAGNINPQRSRHTPGRQHREHPCVNYLDATLLPPTADSNGRRRVGMVRGLV